MKAMRILILTLAAAMLLTMAGVYAGDDAAQVIEQPGDEMAVEDGLTASSNDDNALKASDDGTFTALEEKIHNAQQGSTVTLENDYKVDENFHGGSGSVYFDGISIQKRLTIDGRGHTINGAGTGGTVNIFTITSDVTLKNIIFEKGSRAITASSNLNIINCTFKDNALFDDDGGAIYCEGKLTVDNSRFIGNSVVGFDYKLWGGAIYCGEGSTISNSVFDDNTGDMGSAVAASKKGDVTLTGCVFYKNYAYVDGQFVYRNILVQNGNVQNCRFEGYKSTDNVVNGEVVNCVFTGDSSSKDSSSKSVKLTPKIIAKKATFKAKAKTKKFAATLKANNNAPMKNVKLFLKVKGKTYSAKTNSKGKATFKIKKLTKKGTYKAVITFKGNAQYNKITKTVKIVVKK